MTPVLYSRGLEGRPDRNRGGTAPRTGRACSIATLVRGTQLDRAESKAVIERGKWMLVMNVSSRRPSIDLLIETVVLIPTYGVVKTHDYLP